MAKSKTTDGEVVVDEVVEVSAVEVAAPPVSAKAFKFEILAGRFAQGEVLHEQGAVVESDDDLAVIYGSNKFRKVE